MYCPKKSKTLNSGIVFPLMYVNIADNLYPKNVESVISGIDFIKRQTRHIPERTGNSIFRV